MRSNEGTSPVFFMHIPKTAGTSITKIIDQHYRTDDIFPYQGARDLRKGVSNVELSRPITGYRLFRGHFGWPVFKEIEALVGPLQPFTFIREPVARQISQYRHLRRASPDEAKGDPVQLKAIMSAKEKSLKDYILEGHLRSNRQISFLLDGRRMPDDEAVDLAIERLASLAMFGLSEATSESVMLMNKTFGWSHSGPVPFLNTDSGKRDVLTSEDVELLCEITALDRVFYRKAQDLFWHRIDALIVGASDPHPRKLPVSLSMTEALPGVGWHTREGGPEAGNSVVWRWSGPGCHSRVDLLLEQVQDLRVEVAVLNVISHEIHKTLQFSVNGEILPVEQRAAEAGGLIYGVNVPLALAGRNGKLLRLGIHVAHTRSFKELNIYDDPRPFGVAITRIDVLPRTPSPIERAKRWLAPA